MAHLDEMRHGTLKEAIEAADALLPGAAAPEGDVDFRWRAIIRVGRFIQDEPHEVLQFVLRWGGHEDEDLRAAIATCLLEHLLEHHFNQTVSALADEIAQNPAFRSMCRLCWEFGDLEVPERRLKWRGLLAQR